jgi:hypothetical protein
MALFEGIAVVDDMTLFQGTLCNELKWAVCLLDLRKTQIQGVANIQNF